MKRGCFRVSPLGTDVTRVVVRPSGAITRCVSLADTSLSLSLSLSTPDLLGQRPSSGAKNGADHRYVDRSRRGCARGVCRARCEPLLLGGGR
jgi:hypothetical protein